MSNNDNTARRETVFNTIDDLVINLTFYDRKEDEDLPLGVIEEMVKAGEVTIDEMVERFRQQLTENLEDSDDDDDSDDEWEDEEEDEDDA